MKRKFLIVFFFIVIATIVLKGNKEEGTVNSFLQKKFSLEIIEIQDTLFLDTIDSIFKNNQLCRNYVYYLKVMKYGGDKAIYLTGIPVTSINSLFEETTHYATFINGRLLLILYNESIANFSLKFRKTNLVITFGVHKSKENQEDEIAFQHYTYWVIYNNQIIKHYTYECIE